ncbi:hypothetical protein AAEX28_13220 [Lentisphaerota bacterium WC36G]|nr:hypothetical protein LJT99_16050 [Lentisphaerae bacterium WC36]
MTKIPDNLKQINTLLNVTIPVTVAENSLKASSAVAGAVAYDLKNSIPSVDLAFFSTLLSSECNIKEFHPWNVGEYGTGKYSQQSHGFLSPFEAINIAQNNLENINNIALIVTAIDLKSFLALLNLVYNVFKLPKLIFLIKRVQNLIVLDSEKMNLPKSIVSKGVSSVNNNLREVEPFKSLYQSTENVRNLQTFEDSEPCSELSAFIALRNAKLVEQQQKIAALSAALATGQISMLKLTKNSSNTAENLSDYQQINNNYTYLASFEGNTEVITFLEEFFSNETGN